ncbi:MAG: hypothetical protein V4690_03245 [Patescibacteria group bacterium]
MAEKIQGSNFIPQEKSSIENMDVLNRQTESGTDFVAELEREMHGSRSLNAADMFTDEPAATSSSLDDTTTTVESSTPGVFKVSPRLLGELDAMAAKRSGTPGQQNIRDLYKNLNLSESENDAIVLLDEALETGVVTSEEYKNIFRKVVTLGETKSVNPSETSGTGIHDFAEIPNKPTEILIEDNPEVDHVKNIEEARESFQTPKEVMTYISELIKQGKPLGTLEFYISSSHTLEDALQAVRKRELSGALSPEEVEKIEKMLGVDKSKSDPVLDIKTDEAVTPTKEPELPEVAPVADMTPQAPIEPAVPTPQAVEDATSPEAIITITTKDIEDAIKLSDEALVALAIKESNEGRQDNFWEKVNSIADLDVHTRVVSALIQHTMSNEDLTETDFEDANTMAEEFRVPQYKISAIAQIAKTRLEKLAAVSDKVEEDSEKAPDPLKNEAEKLISAANENPDRFMDLVAEYAETGKAKEFWNLVDSIDDDVAHDKILTELIIDNIVQNGVKNVKTTADKIRTPSVKQKVTELFTAFESKSITKNALLKELRATDLGQEVSVKADDYIGEDEFEKFVITGQINDSILENIADKIAKGGKATDREEAIYQAKSAEIEAILARKKAESEEPVANIVDIPAPAAAVAPDAEPEEDLPAFMAPMTTPDVAPIVPTTPDTVVDAAPVETIEQINGELEQARSDYAAQTVAWNAALAERKRKYGKLILSLGKEGRQMPEVEKPQELIDAEKAYMSSKEKKAKALAALAVTPEEKERFDSASKLTPEQLSNVARIHRLMDQAEGEWESLQAKKSELSPAENETLRKMKEKVGKAAAIWAKVPMAVRLSIAPILIGTGVAFTGGLILGAGYAGKKLVRGVVGAAAARKVGSWKESSYNKINDELELEAKEAYLDETTGTFEEREKRYAEFKAEEAKRIKNQKIKKAMFMVGAGAGAGILEDLASSGVSSGYKAMTGNSNQVQTPEAPKAPETVVKPPPATPEVVDVAKDMKVELSSKGFLDDIHKIKAEMLGKYGSVEAMPENLRENFYEKPSMQLAKDFGFFDAKTGASGMGLKGEVLAVDAKGNLVYEHGGKTQVILNAETGEINKFDGKMFKPNVSVPETSPTIEEQTLNTARGNFIAEDTKFGVGEELNPTLEQQTGANFREGADFSKVPPELETVVVPEQPEIVTPEAIEQAEKLAVWEDEFTHVSMTGEGVKIRALNDNFQEGPQYADVRKAFAENFSKNITSDMNIVAGQPFEGGRIDVVRNPSTGASQLLLNGKEIAKGYVVPGQNSMKLVETPGVKSGFWFADTVYERAFKASKDMIKTLSNNPSIIPKK